jgi:hypothetical protein
MVRRAVMAGLAMLLSASVAHAQLRPKRDSQLSRAGIGRERAPAGQENRQQLQRRVQQRLWQMTKQRVGLSDDQMRRLAPVHQRFEIQRRTITRQERQTRLALRDALRDSTRVDQAQISSYLDRLVQLQRERADMLDQEQKALAEVMTPLQRARYTALQEQVRRRIQQLARPNGPGGAADSSAMGAPRP